MEDLEMKDSLLSEKPGWIRRVFGLESAKLIACDARPGEGWARPEPFNFLYRGKLGGLFLQTGHRTWREISRQEARALFERLPVVLEDSARPWLSDGGEK
jgi:hypothetical protein